LALFLLTNCNTVSIKDEKLIASLGTNGGTMVDMFSGAKSPVDYPTIISLWNNLDNIQVMCPLTTIQDFEYEIAQLCTNYGNCNQQQANQINELVYKIHQFTESAKSNGSHADPQ
jgi:hypothetical protein